jgi:hypothetical protein
MHFCEAFLFTAFFGLCGVFTALISTIALPHMAGQLWILGMADAPLLPSAEDVPGGCCR